MYALTQFSSKFTKPKAFRFSSSLAKELLEIIELEDLACIELDEPVVVFDEDLTITELEVMLELLTIELIIDEIVEEETVELERIADELVFDFS